MITNKQIRNKENEETLQRKKLKLHELMSQSRGSKWRNKEMRNTQKKCKENSKIVLRNKTKEEEGRE
jgi:hypothetical protein